MKNKQGIIGAFMNSFMGQSSGLPILVCPQKTFMFCREQPSPEDVQLSLTRAMTVSVYLVKFSAKEHPCPVGYNVILQGVQGRDISPGYWLRTAMGIILTGTPFLLPLLLSLVPQLEI